MLFNNIVHDLTKIVNKIKRLSLLAKALLVLSLILIILLAKNHILSSREGYEEKSEYILKEGPEIYDGFYANIYDDLVYNKLKNEYEIGSIINSTKPTSHSILLDIGSGTGHHLNLFKDSFSEMVGLDISPDMVKLAQQNYPSLNYQVGNALDNMMYESNSFTHVTCLYFTIYYIKDKKQFFENVYNWLMPGGYLSLHLVDRDKFDPIVPAGDPTLFISPQKYAKERITQSVVKFDNYEYKYNSHTTTTEISVGYLLRYNDKIFFEPSISVRKEIGEVESINIVTTNSESPVITEVISPITDANHFRLNLSLSIRLGR